MRCVVALMQHETNTFSPLTTPLHTFASGVGLDLPPRGNQAIEIYGKAGFAFSAMIDAATERNAEISIPIAAYAEPSGRVEDSAFEAIAESICADVAAGCDAVLLDLHGAMVTESFDDGEGELLKRIRQIDPKVPIAVALDFHTNLSEEMTANCNVMDGYRTYPHIDMYETGQRAARSLFRIIDNQMSTKLHWRSLPMLTHMINQTPLRQPMKDIMNLAIDSADAGEVMNASVFGGFPLADIPYATLSVVVVEPEESENGESLVNNICDMAWQRRTDFIFEPEILSESIARAAQLIQFPVVIADHGDNCGAGGSADDLTVLDEMLSQGLTNIVAGPFWDPEAVAAMIDAGEGADLTLRVGGKTDAPAVNQTGYGLTLSGRVSKITDGKFTITGPMQTGLEVNLGRTVILKTPALELVLSEYRWEPYDPGCFTHAGIDPTEKHYILIKSRQHFRASFESIAQHVILAAGPGVCSSDYRQFSFRHVERPIYPLDPDMSRPSNGCITIISEAN
ncbi:MAG: M81 family metallopeptidase [bacterium]